MKKIIISLLAVMLLFTACADQATNSEPAQALRVGLMPDDGILPYLYGAQQGYFGQAGVTVEFTTFLSALDRDAALQAGELDAIYSDVISLVYYAEAGIPLKAVSSTQATYGIAVQEGDSLEGKSVGLSTNTLMEYLVDQALTTAGLSEETIEKIAIPSLPNRLESFRAGQLDAIALPEPMLSLAVLDQGSIILTGDSIGLAPGVLLVDSTWLDKGSDQMAAFFAGYNKAVEGLNAGPDAEDLTAIYNEATFPESIQGHFVLPVYDMAQAPEESQIQMAIDWLQSRQLIEGDHDYESLTARDLLQ